MIQLIWVTIVATIVARL